MVEDEPSPKPEADDRDTKLKLASEALIAEMEQLIRRAKTLQKQHEALVAERRKLKDLP